MKRSVTLKTNFSANFGAHVPEILKRFNFKGAINGNIDGTCVIESSYDVSVEELKELFGEEVEGLAAGSKYLQESLEKDCAALMQSIKTSAFKFQEMEHELNLQIQKDNAEESKLR